jgi:hypothetical protein
MSVLYTAPNIQGRLESLLQLSRANKDVLTSHPFNLLLPLFVQNLELHYFGDRRNTNTRFVLQRQLANTTEVHCEIRRTHSRHTFTSKSMNLFL